jgi:hypothetical protein
VRTKAAEPDDGETAGGEQEEPETHDRIVVGATSRAVQRE